MKREMEEKAGGKEEHGKKRIKLEVASPKAKTPKVSRGGGERQTTQHIPARCQMANLIP